MFDESNMKKNVIGLEDLNTKIYRIFPLDRFLDMFYKGENVLVNPSKWEDPFENFLLKGNAEMPDGNLVSLSQLYQSWYGQCWTRNRDSDAMWRIYSANKTGVRVETTVGSLFSNFYNSSDKFASLKYFIGSVEYWQKEEIERFLKETTFTGFVFDDPPPKLAKALLIKRQEFSHENEVRLIFQDVSQDGAGQHGKDGFVSFKFPWSEILTEIAFDPRLSESDYEEERRKLISLGCGVNITQSELYKFTPINIKL
ncbi:MAG: DUF2971 domain-containing protein [Thermomonas hydrothermalis]|uniref:DUF2971 domain-containing protein n=1 Tax=Thermomonas hydrothermalis TaxID=213588 RepID=UPI0023567F8A|nr:DUF2971 domain-containing protein [Thermomonas hydrothermalis]MCL6619355.1 DUF2971 domain-containing protein [Thermomonas hydrothermalis]